MTTYQQIFENNKKWAAEKLAADHDFFENLAEGQNPDYLFIACSDSRVSPELITGSAQGELFVHRNVGNLVNSDDPNVIAAIDFAVLQLKVKHIIVCGHYDCGAVKASFEGVDGVNTEAIKQWIKPLNHLIAKNRKELESLSENLKYKRLVEINVREQCNNVSQSKNVQKLYRLKGKPVVHGWVYDLPNGELIDLNI